MSKETYMSQGFGSYKIELSNPHKEEMEDSQALSWGF